MTADAFRRLALALPEALEKSHMGHPDFRVGGKIFATLGSPDVRHGMVKLTPDQQEAFTSAEPAAFVPVNGSWGAKGATYVRLGKARAASVKTALALAWSNTAPKHLAALVSVD